MARHSSLLSWLAVRRETLLAVAILALVGLVETRFSGFAAPGNLAAILDDSAILIILMLGQMAVILTRAIDLSVAANLAFTGMAAAMLAAAHPGLPLPIVILAAAGIGLLLGAINGLMVWKLDIPPIVGTLGTLTIYRGLAFELSGGAWVNTHQFPPDFLAFPRASIAGLTVLSWIAIALVFAAVVVFTRTVTGRAFHAVGGNATASVYAGIDPGRTRFIAFCLSGLMAGLSGYLWVARYAVAYVDLANGFELDVIAACVIGGISIAGGVGTVAGGVMGALFLGLIKNALPVAHISPFWQMAISGTVIIAAVIINARGERVAGRRILKAEGRMP